MNEAEKLYIRPCNDIIIEFEFQRHLLSLFKIAAMSF